GVARVRAVCRRLAIATDRLAEPVLVARWCGFADLGFCLEAVAGKPSRFGSAAAPLPRAGGLLGHRARSAVFPLCHSRYPDVPWTFVYCSMIGSINATASGLAMRDFGHAAGMASALIGIFLYGGGTLASMAMGAFITPATPIPLSGLMAGFGISGVTTYLLFR